MNTESFINKKIMEEMKYWSKQEHQYIVNHLARMLNCHTKYISCISIYPGEKEGYDCGFIFFGPGDTLLGEIRWDNKGGCTDFIAYEDNIAKVHDYIARRRAERAREKSVNRSQEQAKEREISLGKELVGFVKTHVKEFVLAVCVLAVLTSSYISIKKSLNPEYVNDSYRAGYQAVSMETHRTNSNDAYWYDYDDIAERYDEKYDFDSWIYGTYKNVGWNKESTLSCMDKVFDALEDRGITEFDSFIEYCDAKGFCYEKDGKLMIDTEEFKKAVEEYMIALNKGEIKPMGKDDKKSSKFRV